MKLQQPNSSFLRQIFLWNWTIRKFDIFYLSETYADSRTTSDDANWNISVYSLMISDHPSNSKRRRVSVYSRRCLPVRFLNIYHLNKCIRLEAVIDNKICCSFIFYRSPDQSQDEFETFSVSLQLNLEAATRQNYFSEVSLRDFNVKLSN